MSVDAVTAVWAMRGLSPTQKLVLVRIADHADPDGGNAWPSVTRMQRDTGLSERAVRGAIRALEDKGVLKTSRQAGKKGTNLYAVDLQWGAGDAGVQEMPPAGDAPLGQQVPSGGQEVPLKGGSRRPRTVLVRQEPPNPSDEVARAVFAECHIEPAKVTRAARKRHADSVAQLVEVGASPDEVKARCAVYRRRWPNASLTPEALSRHWAGLEPPVRSAPKFRQPDGLFTPVKRNEETA